MNIEKGVIVRLKNRAESHVVLDIEGDDLRLARLTQVANPVEWVREDRSEIESIRDLKRGDRILHVSNLDGIKLVVMYTGLGYAMALEAIVASRFDVEYVTSERTSTAP